MVKSASRVNSRRDARHAANYFALLAAMPFRRPEWRFELAQQIVAENLGRAWTAIDPTVAVAVDHLRAGDGMSKLLAPADRRRLRDLRRAQEIYQENGPIRWILEARVLARQSVGQIARLCRLPRAVVQLYEQVFFDVRPRLDARDAILVLVMRKMIREEIGDGDVDVILKHLAYSGGIGVLNAVAPILLAPELNIALLPEPQQKLAMAVQKYLRLLIRPWTLASSGNDTASPATSEAKQRPQSLLDIQMKFVAWASALKRKGSDQGVVASGSIQDKAPTPDSHAAVGIREVDRNGNGTENLDVCLELGRPSTL